MMASAPLNVKVVLGLLSFEGQVRTKSLQVILILMAHRYPRVRKHAAEQLYTVLLVDETILPVEAPVYEGVLDKLTCVVWDADQAQVKEERDAIAAMVGVLLPKPTKKAGVVKKKREADELESYAFLVNEAGY